MPKRQYPPEAYLQCRWCEWKTLRFSKKKPGHRRLLIHAIDAHEEAFLRLHQCTTLDEYLGREEAFTEEIPLYD